MQTKPAKRDVAPRPQAADRQSTTAHHNHLIDQLGELVRLLFLEPRPLGRPVQIRAFDNKEGLEVPHSDTSTTQLLRSNAPQIAQQSHCVGHCGERAKSRKVNEDPTAHQTKGHSPAFEQVARVVAHGGRRVERRGTLRHLRHLRARKESQQSSTRSEPRRPGRCSHRRQRCGRPEERWEK